MRAAAQGVLDALRSRTLAQRVAIVVAHPDDETIAAGGSLHLLPDLLLVHVTDGAPPDLADARRSGFATAGEYAAEREAELAAALRVAGTEPHRARLCVADQAAVRHVAAITGELVRLLELNRCHAVITHAYEGGHPDHDATALAVHGAAARLHLPVVEFAGYHAGPGGTMRAQRFLPNGPAETRVVLPPEDAARKRAMLGCFITQSGVLAAFGDMIERFRPAPVYDFAAPPHPGPLNYENWGMISGQAWRALTSGTTACAS